MPLERVRIDQAGKVGIGTTTAMSKLHLAGDGGAGGATWPNNGLVIQDTNASGRMFSISSRDGTLGIADESAAALRMTLSSTGNFGIGTAAPAYKLDVLGDVNSSTVYRLNNGTVGANFQLNGNNNPILNVVSNHGLEFRTNNTERMRIDAGGNVGIGTATPTRGILEVAGVVSATTAVFGTGNKGISLVTNHPGVYWNSYWNAGAKAMSSGYSATFSQNPSTGQMNVGISPTAATAADEATSHPMIMALLPNGKVYMAEICDEAGANCKDISTGWGTGTSSGTAGYVQVSGGSGAFTTSGTTAGQQLFWDNTNKRLGLGTATPRAMLDVSGAVRLKAGAPGNDSAAVGLAFEDNGDTGLFMTNYTNSATGDLHLYTNATPRLTVQADGKVGVGVPAPTYRLDVASTSWGSARFSTSGANDNAVLVNADIGQNKFVRFSAGVGNAARWDIGADSTAETGGNAGADLFFNRFNDAGVYINTPMAIRRSTGIIDTYGTIQASGGLRAFNTLGTAYGGSYRIMANGDNAVGGGLAVSDDGGFYDYNDAWVTFNGATGLKIAGSSGAASQGSLLMQGEIRVNQGWSPNQELKINSNQIWKSVTTGDSSLYLQNSCEGCAVVVGDNVGAANGLYAYGPIGAKSTVRAGWGAGTVGIVGLNSGDAANPGYVEWFRPDAATRIGYMGWGTSGANNLNITLENSAEMNINGGNVGIGIANPEAGLHLFDRQISATGIYGAAFTTSSSWAGLALDSGTSTKSLGVHFGDGNDLRLGRYANGLAGWEGNPYRFDIDAPNDTIVGTESGQVGIGITSPAAKLDVGGSIKTTGGTGSGIFFTGGGESIVTDAGFNMLFRTQGNTTRMVLGNDGKLTTSGEIQSNATNPFIVGTTGFAYFPSNSAHLAWYKKAGATHFYWRRSDNGYSGGANETTLMYLTDAGHLEIAGNGYKPGGGVWAASSDARLKDVDGAYEQGLDSIVRLNTVKFHYKKDNPRKEPSDRQFIGLIAQDVQKVFPEAVSERGDGYLDLDASPINYALINAVKELKAANDNLKSENEALRDSLDDLRSRVEKLEYVK